jgi:osmotically-inducible protein OsmY
VRQALEWDVFVPQETITSTVTDGWVTLEGVVESWSQRSQAEHAVRNLRGVKWVTNNLTVRPATRVTADVRKAVEQALERRAEREARRIRVDVAEGRVTLTGAVHSWAERRSVIGAARFTPGVAAVVDHLRVEPV